MSSLALILSKLPVGSSAKMIFGSIINALAIAALCCCPPEHCEGYLSNISSIPNCFESLFNFSICSSLLILLSLNENKILSLILSESIKL